MIIIHQNSFLMLHSCTSRYVGDFCQFTNPCLTAPRCQNGGTCQVILEDNTATFKCKCPMGFSASLCEISEDTACSSSPCKNHGECILKSLEEYECRCPEGFSGLFPIFIMITTTALKIIALYFMLILFFSFFSILYSKQVVTVKNQIYAHRRHAKMVVDAL